MAKYGIYWPTTGDLIPISYTCGHCGSSVAPGKGWSASSHTDGPRQVAAIFICHNCNGPTFIDPDGDQIPGIPHGEKVSDIPDENIAELYEEARRATTVSAYTAAVMCCRTLLMHIAVNKGAQPGKSFASYVEYLATNAYIPPDAKCWVDHIRNKANEATHEIVLMSKGDAEELLSFTGMLLKIVYEFPATMQKRIALSSTP